MSIVFVGGEPSDFTWNGMSYAISTDGDRYRTDKARCATILLAQDDTRASFTHDPLETQWFGAYCDVYSPAPDGWTGDILTWKIGGQTRLILRAVVVGSQRRVRLLNVSGSTETTLATSSIAFPLGLGQLVTMVKWSETGGQVSVWKNDQLLINHTGNPIPSGSTGIPNGMTLGCPDTAGTMAISEVLVSSRDTRLMYVHTLVPTGDGDVNQWVGSYDAVDEIDPSEIESISATSSGRRIGLMVSAPTGLSVANRVRAIKVVANAQKGDDGPGTLKIGLRQGGVSGYAPQIAALTTTFQPYSGLFIANPATGQEFTLADLAQIQIAFETAG